MTGIRGFKRRNFNLPTLALVLMAALVFGPTLVFRWAFLDLRSVTVTPDLTVTVDRIIRQDFLGSYTVTLRRASDSRFICGGEPEPRLFTYRKAASAKNPVTFTFREWAALDSTPELSMCRRRGFRADEAFVLNTCHEAYWPNGWMLGRRCVRSNEFTPTPEAMAALQEDQ